MKFIETTLTGAFIIEVDQIDDERGYFARSFCKTEFEQHGLISSIVQCNISFNKKQGTLRGIHFQEHPYEEAKIISCVQGRIFDVIVDLRKDSPTFCQWFGIELISNEHKMLYIPHGCGHGFQTLTDESVVYYQISQCYSPEHARGVRWDDSAFMIKWPSEPTVISERDRNFPVFVRH